MVVWPQLWWKLWFCREIGDRVKSFSWQDSRLSGLPCHTSFSFLKYCIFLWTLLDSFQVMEISFKPFWLWTKTTSAAADPRNALAACMLHFLGHTARSQALWTSALACRKPSGLLATLQQSRKAPVPVRIAVGCREAPKKMQSLFWKLCQWVSGKMQWINNNW